MHSSYWSIKWYGRTGRFKQGLAAPPAKLPAILSSVLKGHEGEFSLQNNTILEISKSSPPFLPKLWIKQMKKISFCVSWTALDWQLHVSQLQWRTKGSLHHQHKQHKGKRKNIRRRSCEWKLVTTAWDPSMTDFCAEISPSLFSIEQLMRKSAQLVGVFC